MTALRTAPRRLADDPGANPLVRDLIGAARCEVPGPDAVLRMAARLEALEAAPSAAGSGAGGVSAKLAAVVAAGAGLVTAVAIALSVAGTDPSREAAAAPELAAVAAQLGPASPGRPGAVTAFEAPATVPHSRAAVPAPAPAALRSRAAVPAPAPAAPRAAAPAPAPTLTEAELIRRARTRLHARDHRRALALVRRHVREHPSGLLAEEREAIAIEALAGLGRTAAAAARLDAFRARHPESAYARRLESVVAAPPSGAR